MQMPSAGGGWWFVLRPVVRTGMLSGRPVPPARVGRVELVFVAPARPLRQKVELFARSAQERPRTVRDTMHVLLGRVVVVGGIELASAAKADRHGAWGRLRVPGRGDFIEKWLFYAGRTRRARRRPWLRFHREDEVRTVPARASWRGMTPLPSVTEVRAGLGGRPGVCTSARRRRPTRRDRPRHCRVVRGYLLHLERRVF